MSNDIFNIKPVINAPEVTVATSPAQAPTTPVTPTQTAQEGVPSSTGSETPKPADDEDDTPKPDRLSMLKMRATAMGISYSNNISEEVLSNKIKDKLAGNAEVKLEPVIEHKLDNEMLAKSNDAVTTTVTPVKQKTLRQHLRDEAMRLIRVRITNLDPKKKDLPGEIITVANDYIGTVRKYIPFGEQTEDGYHIPFVLYEELKSRKFVSIKTKKVRGQIQVEHGWATEYSLDVLEPLTEKELQNLAIAQQAAGSVE